MVRNIYTVYMHVNKKNGKKYIGITCCKPEIRWKNGYGYSDSLPFGRAVRKYGWDNFEHIIVKSGVSEKEAKETEICLIKALNTTDDNYGYNICLGGEGIKGYKHTDETKAKISARAKLRVGELNPNFGHRWSDDAKRAFSERKKPITEEQRKKLSHIASQRIGEKNPFYGKHHTENARNKMSQKANKRRVDMYDTNMNFIKTFESIKDASIEMEVCDTAIANCCKGKSKTSCGYIWKYSD